MPTVLIVSYERSFYDVARDILEHEVGCDTRRAETAAEAYPLLRDHPEPLIVIFGDRLPDADGLDILRAVDEGGPRLQRHAYIEFGNREAMLFNEPMLSEYRDLLGRFAVARLSFPFAVDFMLRAVRKAEQRLPSGASGERRRGSETH